MKWKFLYRNSNFNEQCQYLTMSNVAAVVGTAVGLKYKNLEKKGDFFMSLLCVKPQFEGGFILFLGFLPVWLILNYPIPSFYHFSCSFYSVRRRENWSFLQILPHKSRCLCNLCFDFVCSDSRVPALCWESKCDSVLYLCSLCLGDGKLLFGAIWVQLLS